MKVVGKVSRFSSDKVRNMDDPFFSEYLLQTKGVTARKLYGGVYSLCSPNRVAGYSGLVKYDKPQPVLDGQKWCQALQWAEKHFMCMGGAKVWDDFDFVKSELNLSASAGYPWNLCRETASKKQFYSLDTSQEFVNTYWQQLAGENPPAVFWTNNVKEEIRPVEKILVNKLRTFVGGPVEHIHACTRLFGDMNDKFYRSANVGIHWSFVGGTKFYKGWQVLFKRLNKHPNAFELDESEYDASLFREAMYSMALFRWNMLSSECRTPDNKRRIWNAYVEIVDSVIVAPDGEVIHKNTGNPSGSANTIVDNTVILFMLLAYAWLTLCPEDFVSYQSFMENVEAALNGDDNTWTCSDLVVPWFNAEAVSKIWSSLGVTTKYGDSSAPRKLIDCSFLSTGFKKVGSCVVPFPEGEKIFASLAFHLKSKTPRWSLLRAFALRIESYWDQDTRDQLLSYINWLMINHSVELQAPRETRDPHDLFSFSEVMTCYKTDYELRCLYLCEEGGFPVGFLPRSVELLSLVGLDIMGKGWFTITE